MDNQELVDNWQNKIIDECQKRLDDVLSEKEINFIRSRKSFLALEMIEDTVSSLYGAELKSYLNSDSD